MSQFKFRDTRCPHCNTLFKRPEEKETDVAMAVKLLEVFALSESPIAVLMTGDKVSQKLVHAARFPDLIKLADGRVLVKPPGWQCS